MSKAVSAAALMAALLTGCNTGPGVQGRDTEVPVTRETALSSESTGAAEEEVRPPPERSIFYRYDAYTIEQRYQALVVAHAQFLRDHPELSLRIEGNCDERGSSTYNLALGQRRADFVKRMLVLLGLEETRITAVSLGAERPRTSGRARASLHSNRRSDLIYVGSTGSMLER